MSAPSTYVNPLWAGPCLLTPIHLDALVVGTPNRDATWAEVGMDYRQLTGGLDPAPRPFQDRRGNPPATGVHLHWTLPYALRRGRQQAAGTAPVTFPAAPNRWLVTRFNRVTQGAAPVATAWVLQSDYIGTATDATNAFPNPQRPSEIVYLGRQLNLADWTGAPAGDTSFLQAPGPGELAWAAVYDNVRNIFAFHDPLGPSGGEYTYAVAGWYARPQDDPLYGAPSGFDSRDAWQALMDGLDWAVGSPHDLESQTEDAIAAFQLWLQATPVQDGPPATAAQRQMASQTLCHGMIFGISWRGPDQAYPVPPILAGGQPPTVAIGSNAAESVAAWMGSYLHHQDPSVDAGQVENLLLALQTDRIFDYLQDPATFSVAAHNASFAVRPGGRSWVVARPQDTTSQGTGGVQQIPLDDRQTDLLTILNATQAELDDRERQLASAKWELFSASWKLEHLDPTDPDYDQLSTRIQAYIGTLSAAATGIIPSLEAAIARLNGDRDTQRSTLQGLLATEYEVSVSETPRYAQPADPVVLIAGASSDSKLDPPAGGDTGGNTLFTRFTGQAVGGLHVMFQGINDALAPLDLTSADLQPALSALAPRFVPKEAADLWIECLLLDPGNSTWLASLAFQKAGVPNPGAMLAALADRIAKQQTLIWNDTASFLDQRTVGESAGLLPQFAGQPVTVPSKTAVAQWAPPWTPLYVDWEAEWFPSAATPQGMLEPWSLGDFDFSCTGTAVAPRAGTIQARTILSSNYPKGLATKIDTFLDTAPHLPAYQVQQLRDSATRLATLDVLTQSLTGLNDRMIMRRMMASQPPRDPSVQQLTRDVMTWIPATSSGDSAGFFPIRAGHFQITRLRVVDAFGQVLPASPLSGPVLPVRSGSLTPADPAWQSYMQVTPRVAQGARLDFRLVGATNDALRSNSSDDTSPICGWLLPNHLDEGLLVFDANGASLGEILKVERDAGASLRWDAAPGSDAPLGSPPRIPNRHLSALVNALLQRGLTTTQPLDDLLGLIDVTLWATDPLGPARGGNLSVLVGRPIVVVRAAVSFQLDGAPVSDQSWQATGTNETADFTSVRLPIRVGDYSLSNNGALGYFQDDRYDVCYAMRHFEPQFTAVRTALSRSSRAPREAVVRLTRGNMAGLRAVSSGAAPGNGNGAGGYIATDHSFSLPCGGAAASMLTVLVDPRGVIPAVTGSLPVQTIALPNGPVDAALSSMAATFRMGPLLLDPEQIRVPLPSAIGGKWSWIERSGVTFWREQGPLRPAGAEATLRTAIPTLREGWLTLSGALPVTGKERQ